jgi:hypothetical protein
VLAAHKQALGDEAVECVEIGAGDRLGGLHGCAAGEDREAFEALLLGVAEQVVAPVDGCAQRLLASGRVTGAGGQGTDGVIQALGNFVG